MKTCRDCGDEFEEYLVGKIWPAVCKPCRKLIQTAIRAEIPIPRPKYRGSDKAENTYETKHGRD